MRARAFKDPRGNACSARAHAGPCPPRAWRACTRGCGPCALGARACGAVARALAVRAPAGPWACAVGMLGARRACAGRSGKRNRELTAYTTYRY